MHELMWWSPRPNIAPDAVAVHSTETMRRFQMMFSYSYHTSRMEKCKSKWLWTFFDANVQLLIMNNKYWLGFNYK